MRFEIPFVFFITCLAPLFLLSILIIKQKTKDNTTKRLPPGPPKLPIIGNLHQLEKHPHKSLQNLSKQYGDLMFLQMGFVPALIVSSPDRAREIFKAHDLILSGRPSQLYAAKKFTYNLSSISAAPYGEYWRELRKIMVLELMTMKRIQSFGKERAEEVAVMIDRITESVGNDIPIDLSSLAFSLSNNVVCRVAFGTGVGKNSYKFQEILQEVQQLAGEFNVADYFPWMAWINKFNGVDKRMNKNFQDLDRFYDTVIKEHVDPMRPKSDHEDIVDVLLRIQKDPNQGITLKDEHIKGFLVDVFLAGTDTSAATIVWTMAELIRNPLAKQKAQQEVRKMAKGKTKVEETDLQSLTYLKHVIKESLRLHPPAPLLVPRETTEVCTIDDKYEIPAKTRVIFNGAAISTDPGYWENPERFYPERFMNKEVDFRGQHFEFLPFGAGRRGCPGMNFALHVVELTLANLLFCFDWELPEGISAKDVDMEEALGTTVHKKTPLRLVASVPMHE